VEKWEKAEECWPEAEERVRKEYEGVVSAFDAERVGHREELGKSKTEVQSLRRELLEAQGTRRAKMVDKGVRALPRPEVSSTLVQTDGGSGGLSWAGIAAKGSERGGSRPSSAPKNVGSEELAPKSGTVGKKSAVTARGLVVHGVSCRQGMAGLWHQARRMRMGAGNTVVGVRWLLSWERRLQKTVSSIVVYFSRYCNVDPGGVWFGGRRRPVEEYEFGRVPVESEGW